MDKRRLASLVGEFKSKRLLVVGNVMLDRYIIGNVSRISPEAPVPVVHVQRETAYPGGAANVARNLLPFAQPPAVIGVYGPGPHGQMLLKRRSNWPTAPAASWWEKPARRPFARKNCSILSSQTSGMS